jgi:phage protein D
VASAHEHRLIPDCRVSIAGKKLPVEKDARLTRVDVDLNVDLIGQCALLFNDPQLALIDGQDFKAGVPVKVEIGFAAKMTKVFEGEVVALEPQFRSDLPPSLRVICQESIHRLALQTRTRAFNQVDDKQIATRIAQEHGLTANAPSGSKEHVLQGNVSDAAFLRRIAGKHGNHLRIEGKKIVIGPPPKGKQITISPGDGLKKMRVRIKAGQQVSEISVHGWDAKNKQEIIGKAKAQGVTGEGSQKHGGGSTLSFARDEHMPADTATADAMAQGRMRKIAEGFVDAQAEMIGHPGVVPGAELTFEKLGDTLDGTYRVEKARHEFSRRGYFTSFSAVRIAKKQPPKAAAAAQKQAQQAAPHKAPGKFVEIELVDDKGKPVGGAAFRIELPDGAIVEGRVDHQGCARVDGVDPGTCQITFPGLDAGEWDKA